MKQSRGIAVEVYRMLDRPASLWEPYRARISKAWADKERDSLITTSHYLFAIEAALYLIRREK